MVEAIGKIIRYREPLKGYTSFRVGGPAEVFAEPTSMEELREVLCYRKEQGLPLSILGMGSKLLVSDSGVGGMVLHMPSGSFSQVKRRDSEVVAEAGVSLPRLIRRTVEWELAGLEALAGIPGSLGGAVAMNAGGKYGTIGRLVKGLTAVSFDGELHYYKRGEIDFRYRGCSLSDQIILEVELELEKGEKARILRHMKEIYQEKRKTQPLSSRSAGCVFKNPSGYSAGALIEGSGLKGLRVGHAMVSKKHANFIVNLGSATAAHIVELIQKITDEVKRCFGVFLELELKVW